MARSIQIVIYMTQELLEQIDTAAARNSDNRSEWIRDACERKLRYAETLRETELMPFEEPDES